MLKPNSLYLCPNKAIGSLMELMKLMGPKYITQVKMKVIGILRYTCTYVYQGRDTFALA